MAASRHKVALAMALLAASAAQAQENPGTIAPLPFASPQQRITPAEPDAAEAGMLTTHKTDALPWQPPARAAAPTEAPASVAPTPTPLVPKPAPVARGLPAAMPFGRSTASEMQAEVPAGPRPASAVPVENVDRIEQSDQPAAPPSPIAPGANPVNEDPTEPTELTAPLFKTPDTGAARTVVIRALNKVTAQAVTLQGRPGDSLKFGQLVIIPLTCRVSDPSSQTDYAGLLDIKENIPGKQGLVPRFHGWMYASSPSVNALEHPVYDISMAGCTIAGAPKEEAEKTAKKADKKTAKK